MENGINLPNIFIMYIVQTKFSIFKIKLLRGSISFCLGSRDDMGSPVLRFACRHQRSLGTSDY